MEFERKILKADKKGSVGRFLNWHNFVSDKYRIHQEEITFKQFCSLDCALFQGFIFKCIHSTESCHFKFNILLKTMSPTLHLA